MSKKEVSEKFPLKQIKKLSGRMMGQNMPSLRQLGPREVNELGTQ